MFKVHDFNGNNGTCTDLRDGNQCGLTRNDPVHQFKASSGLWTQEVTVQVYTGRDLPGGGIHYCTFAWQPENDRSWFSGWYMPHNDSRWFHVEELDVKSAHQIGMVVRSALDGYYTEEILVEMGMTSQYVISPTPTTV